MHRFIGGLFISRQPSIAGGSGLDDKASTAFCCSSQQLDGATCLALSGELDLATVGTFRAHLKMAEHATHGIVLDLRNLQYLDSTGINALLDAQRALASSGGRMAIVTGSSQVLRILGVLAIERVIPVFDMMDAALAYVRLNGDSETTHTE